MPTWTSSMRALRQGCPLPATLDELRGPLLAEIAVLNEELSTSYDDLERSLLEPQLLADGSQSLAIMGERGSGKSTLLTSVSIELARQQRHIILPIMRPELFGDTDSVVGTFLAELWEIITLDSGPQDTEAPGTSAISAAPALKLLVDASRNYAVSRTPSAALEHSTDSPTEYADDILAVSRSAVRLTRQLRALASELCLPSHPTGSRLIIVPIDDPDLARHSIVSILTDVQILGSVPGIVPLICFSPSDLNGAWLAAMKELMPATPDEHLHFLLARQLEKVFPYRCRFEIEPVAPPYRLAFTPISDDVPLAAKLATLRACVERESGSPWPFDAAASLTAPQFGLRNPLPDNPRTLVQLWEALDALERETAPDTLKMLHLTLRRMISILTERVAARLGTTTSQLVQVGAHVPDLAKRPLTSHIDNVRLFISAEGAEVRATEPTLVHIHLRALHRVRAALRQDSKRSADLRPEDYLSGEIIAELLTLQEISYGTGLFDVDGTRLSVGQAEWTFLQSVDLANQTTDDTFLMLPEATTLAEVLRSATLWNRLTDLSGDLTSEAVLATGVVAACLTVDEATPLSASHDYEAAFEQACAMYSHCAELDGNTPQAFLRWFEAYLPFQWHSAFLGGERIRSLVETHQELIKPRSASYIMDRISGEEVIERRLALLLDNFDDTADDNSHPTWIAGYFALASALGSEHLDRLSQIYPLWRRDSAGVQAGAISVGAVKQGRPRTKPAPYATPEGTELFMAGTAALRRARATARREFRGP